MARKGQEEATEWLKRVMSDRSVPADVRRLARFALGQWVALSASWKARGVKTRRSLWDLLSGILQIARQTTHHPDMVEVRSGEDFFYFPVFEEACDYRGKKAPASALRSGVRVLAHRLPQTAKWGNTVTKT
jgi:hypothetical protein